mgnify:CR=1 FL=1
MSDWDTKSDVDDMKIATRVANSVRKFEFERSALIPVLGHSRGAQIAYALANDSAKNSERNLGGLAILDNVLVFHPNDIEHINNSCEKFETVKGLIESGIHHTSQPSVFKLLSELADADPFGKSPFGKLPIGTFLTNRLSILSAFRINRE